MKPPPDVELFLLDMIKYARRAVILVDGRTRDDLETDPALDLALERALELIGEAARGVPDDVRSRHPDIPWRQWVAFRNVLIHAYHRVDLDQVWRTSVTELEGLIAAIEHVLEQEFPE
jgi:uncharacterized protein with HEPN domain